MQLRIKNYELRLKLINNNFTYLQLLKYLQPRIPLSLTATNSPLEGCPLGRGGIYKTLHTLLHK